MAEISSWIWCSARARSFESRTLHGAMINLLWLHDKRRIATPKKPGTAVVTGRLAEQRRDLQPYWPNPIPGMLECGRARGSSRGGLQDRPVRVNGDNDR
ncbi:hypothetical protein AHIS1636_02410 [Arthrobacter mangrovi]|uniref:Uncharacterized protein n=1 Tax=Arthrobacter mangrovi TaxID=2966350 RepID=A0ABQ5MPA9_9MICC|nr:hypothetical protein AHIS1636_02410 [Arthrobacter mangrovi]